MNPSALVTPHRSFATAYAFAVDRHAGQFRHDGLTAYIHHIDAVIKRAGPNPIDRAVAAIHDLMENGRATLEELRALGLPEDIIDGALTLTCTRDETYAAYIQRIKNHREGRWVKVKIADILANLADQPTPFQIARYAKALLVLIA